MKKVLYIKGILSNDGATKIAHDLIESISEKTNEFEFDWLLYGRGESDNIYPFKDLCKHIYFMRPKGSNKVKRYILKYVKVVRFMKKNRYDIVHIHTDNMRRVDYVLCARLAGVGKVIMHSHNSSVEDDSGLHRFRIVRSVDRILLRLFCSNKLACSHEAAEWMFGKKGLKDVEYISNGIDINRFIYNDEFRRIVRERLGIAEDELIIGHVGRFVEQKNHLFFVDFIKEFKKYKKEFKVLLVGEGPLRDEIYSKLEKEGCLDHVIFCGVIKDVEKYFSAMDVFVLPSLFEGLPITGVEAQCSGLPCFVSDSISKELRLTDNIQFLPIQKVDEWCKKIAAIKISKGSRNIESDCKLLTEYDINKSAKKLIDIYRE